MSHCPYSPWNTRRFIVGVGLKSIPGQKIFLQDEEWAHYRGNKANVRNENLAKYYPANVGLSDAELSAATNYLKEIAQREGISEVTLLPSEVPFRDEFDKFCCSVQEDISIWKKEGEREWLAAIHLAAPNHWAPEDKIGKSFTDSHIPVPKIAPISQIAGKLFQQGLERGLQERLAWGVATDNRLNHHPSPPSGILLEDWHGRSFDVEHPKLFARVERQTLFPVPGHSLLVFTIRTFFVDVATLPSVDKQQISQCMDSMDEDILRYKGLLLDKSPIQNWLQSYFNL